MGFTPLDAIIVFVYLAGIAAFGMFMGGRQRSARDFFISEKPLPWLAVCITIVATETSAITFLSLPGAAYIGNLNFLQLAIGYIMGRVLVAAWLIPQYADGRTSTAYAFLERSFSPPVRRAASGVFMLTRTFADAVRLYTTAIPLALILRSIPALSGIDEILFYFSALTLLTTLTLLYVFIGGIRAVIWADVMQWTLYVLAAAASVLVLFELLPDSPLRVIDTAFREGKLEVFQTSHFSFNALFSEPYTLAASLLGGMALSMASHGTDQLIVQRVISAGSVANARKAMLLSGIVVFVQFALFLFVGTLLYYFYIDAPQSANEVYSRFIIEEMPPGITGLIIAGILAAAMSTLSSSISALASSTMMDFVIPLRGSTYTEAESLRASRRAAIVWSVVLLLAATLFIQTSALVIELALGIASFVYGPLLGLFLLGRFSRIRSSAAAAGFFAGIGLMALIILLTPLAWTWYTLAGLFVTSSISLLTEQVMKTLRGNKST